MARAQPLYTIDDQYALLDTEFPVSLPTLNIIKYRLLMACSENGTLDTAKNRFLNLVQDTELRLLFSSILDIPEFREVEGTKRLQNLHNRFSPNYGLFPKSIRELELIGIPKYTLDVLTNYFYSNEDPIYKLSAMASVVMMAYIKDDEINNRK
jgi:hypothetical protein